MMTGARPRSMTWPTLQLLSLSFDITTVLPQSRNNLGVPAYRSMEYAEYCVHKRTIYKILNEDANTLCMPICTNTSCCLSKTIL